MGGSEAEMHFPEINLKKKWINAIAWHDPTTPVIISLSTWQFQNKWGNEKFSVHTRSHAHILVELYQINIPPSRSRIPWLYYSSGLHVLRNGCKLQTQKPSGWRACKGTLVVTWPRLYIFYFDLSPTHHPDKRLHNVAKQMSPHKNHCPYTLRCFQRFMWRRELQWTSVFLNSSHLTTLKSFLGFHNRAAFLRRPYVVIRCCFGIVESFSWHGAVVRSPSEHRTSSSS